MNESFPGGLVTGDVQPLQDEQATITRKVGKAGDEREGLVRGFIPVAHVRGLLARLRKCWVRRSSALCASMDGTSSWEYPPSM